MSSPTDNPDQPSRENQPRGWLLEWPAGSDNRPERLYQDELHCILAAESEGGECRPLYALPLLKAVFEVTVRVAGKTTLVASTSGPREDALFEAFHQVARQPEGSDVRIFEVLRVPVEIPAVEVLRKPVSNPPILTIVNKCD